MYDNYTDLLLDSTNKPWNDDTKLAAWFCIILQIEKVDRYV